MMASPVETKELFMKTLVLSVAVVSIVAASLAAFSCRERATEVVDTSLHQPLPLARALSSTSPKEPALSDLQQQVGTLKAQLEALQTKQIVSSREQSAGIAPTEPDPETTQAAQRQAYLSEVVTRFNGESLDPNWATNTKAALSNALESDAAVHSLLHSIDCRARTCRAEFSADSSGEFDRKLPLLVTSVSRSLRTVTVDRADAGSVVLYMSRE
jgi:hypothetical protein